MYTVKYFIQNPYVQHIQTPDTFKTLAYSELKTFNIENL